MMNKEFVKEKVKIAKELVEDIDEQFKTVAFSAVLIKLLDDEKKVEQFQKQPKANERAIDNNMVLLEVQKKKEELAKKCNMPVEELDKILDIRTDYVQLLKIIKGGDVEKQRLASKCILIAFLDVYEKDWIDSNVMIKSLEKSGITFEQLPRNLRGESESFSIKGHGKGNPLKYAITGPAKITTYEIISKLSKGENPLESKSQ